MLVFKWFKENILTVCNTSFHPGCDFLFVEAGIISLISSTFPVSFPCIEVQIHSFRSAFKKCLLNIEVHSHESIQVLQMLRIETRTEKSVSGGLIIVQTRWF